MRRSHSEIGATAATAILSCGATILNAPVLVTAILGISLCVSLGYVWVRVLFGHDVASLERVAVATGLALSVPVLGGIALQAAGIPLHRAAWAGLLAGATLLGDTVLIVRERTAQPVIATSRRPIRWPWPGWHTVIFGAAVVVAAGAVALASAGAAVQRYPGFTQLWLSAHGDATTASLGVSNQQGSTKRYRLVLLRRGRASNIWNLILPNGQTWQRTIPISGTYVTSANLYLLPDLNHPYRHVSTGSDEAPQS
jgi:hypothetical protein